MLAQITGAEEAIKSAAADGWVAVVFVVIVLATFTTFGLVIRQLMNEARERELRYAARQTTLEDFIRGDLVATLKETSVLMHKMLAAAEAICNSADAMSDMIAHCRLSAESHREP